MSSYNTEVEHHEWQTYVGWTQLAAEKGMEAWVLFMEKSDGLVYPAPVRARVLDNDPFALLAAAKSLISWPSADDVLLKMLII